MRGYKQKCIAIGYAIIVLPLIAFLPSAQALNSGECSSSVEYQQYTPVHDTGTTGIGIIVHNNSSSANIVSLSFDFNPAKMSLVDTNPVTTHHSSGHVEYYFVNGFGAGTTKTYEFDITPVTGFSNEPVNVAVTSTGTLPVESASDVTNCLTPITYSTSTAPVSAPDSPTLTGTAGDTQNVLNWTAPTGATGYSLKRGGAVIYTGSALTYTDTGLTNDTAVSYTVQATNSGGDSAPSTSLSLTPTAAYVPPPPETDITVRDEKLIALALTLFISWKCITPFRWRDRNA